MFQATLLAAQHNWAVRSADENAGVISFDTGISLTSNGMACSALVVQLRDGKVEVRLTTQKKLQAFAWGVGGRIANKLFAAIEVELQNIRNQPLPAEKKVGEQ